MSCARKHNNYSLQRRGLVFENQRNHSNYELIAKSHDMHNNNRIEWSHSQFSEWGNQFNSKRVVWIKIFTTRCVTIFRWTRRANTAAMISRSFFNCHMRFNAIASLLVGNMALWHWWQLRGNMCAFETADYTQYTATVVDSIFKISPFSRSSYDCGGDGRYATVWLARTKRST